MASHLSEAAAPPAGDVRRSTRPDWSPNRSVRTGSVIAGAGILLLAALAAVGQLVVIEGLVTDGDAAKTSRDILASEGLFRFGIASWYVVAILDLVVSWALLQVFSPVDRGIARLAAWTRLAYTAVLVVSVSQLAGVPSLLRSDDYSAAFGEEQLQAQAMLKIDTFNDLWIAALVLFGVHLFLLGYLALRSGYVPKVIGVLLVVAGAGYLFDSFGTVLSQGSPIVVSTVTFVGEFVLACWLVIRGRRVSLTIPEAREA